MFSTLAHTPFLLLALCRVLVLAAPLSRSTFVHPGLLHNANDLARVRQHVAAGDEPWMTGWYKLTNNSLSQLGYQPSPVTGLCRGSKAGCTENFSNAFTDYAACYQ